MKIGDKVRFLNSVGGGVVRAVKSGGIVTVEDEDGFEVPMMARDLVVVESKTAEVKSQTKNAVYQQNSPKLQIATEPEETPDGDNLTVFLAFLPVRNRPFGEAFESYLVNDSNYFLSFSYLSKTEEGWVWRIGGEADPNTKLFLDEFTPHDLGKLEYVCLQFTAYKKAKSFALHAPQSAKLRIDGTKFYKPTAFGKNDFFDDPALLYTAVKNNVPAEMPDLSAQLQKAFSDKIRPQAENPKTPISSAQKQTDILVVDLHIDQLLDNRNGLSNKDMLDFQLKKFEEVMRENSKLKGQKIVFIHGKGNGVLKQEILKLLARKFVSARAQDASFREYGFGATLVTIR